jgi:hypothetical protein
LLKFNVKEISQVFWIATLIFLKIANIPLRFREYNNKNKDMGDLGLGLERLAGL